MKKAMKTWSCLLVFFLTCGSAISQTASWQAYNDSVNKNGGTTDETVTMINVGRSSPGPASTELLVFGSGDGTGVTATYEETLSEGSVFWTSDAITFDEESDAAKLFGEALDLTGNISYGDAPGWHMDLILEGLDPNRKYVFAGTAMRGGGLGYAERTTNWKIMGAESFVYASSEGAWKVSEESVEFSTGHNEAGYVAKWTDIAPGADGRVVIRTSHSVGEANGGLAGAHAYKGYAGGVFMLELQPLPAASWQAYNDSVNKNGGTTDETVTMINVGRSSPGPASTELLVFGSGDGTGVTATYEETLSEGSVFWTSDAITFDEESDAAKLFGEALDLTGNISYGDAPGWHMDLILEGLDPNRKYVFAGTAMRGGGLGYAERTTNWKIMGAESFVYASSEGAWKVSEESVEFSTGHNEAGYVAKWTDIAPGADGRVVIRTSHSVGEANGGLAGAHAYKGYAGGVFMLELQVDSGAVAPGNGLSILRVFPKENELEAHPNSPLHVVIEHDTRKVDSSSVALFLDGKKVASEIQQVGDRTLVVHESAVAFEDFSDHTVKVEFADDSDARSQYTKSWNFTVMEWTQYDALPADSAITLTDLGKQERGFAIRVVATDPNEPDPDKEILSDIGDLWWIWDEKHSDHSDRTLFNSEGYYLERAQINYQRDGRTIGNKAGEKLFPGINGTESLTPEGLELPVIHFGLETTALLELDEGYYHMQITTTPIHLLHIGLGDDAVELSPDESVTPGIEDARAWEYKFVVEKPGLYPFTLFYYDYLGGSSSLTASGGTASSLEWLNIAPTGMKYLINGDDDRAITAYIPPDAIVEMSPATMSVLRQDGNMIVTWSEPGTLQGAEKITGPWNDVVGASSPHSVALGSSVMFYRVRH
jgi:hypothetical protein